MFLVRLRDKCIHRSSQVTGHSQMASLLNALGPLVTIKTFDCNKKLHDYDGAVLNSETSPLVCPSSDSARAAMVGQQRRVVNLSAR